MNEFSTIRVIKTVLKIVFGFIAFVVVAGLIYGGYVLVVMYRGLTYGSGG